MMIYGIVLTKNINEKNFNDFNVALIYLFIFGKIKDADKTLEKTKKIKMSINKTWLR